MRNLKNNICVFCMQVAEWVRAFDWRPGGLDRVQIPLRRLRFRNFGNSVYLAFPVPFGGDTKSWSLGGYEFGLELESVLGKFDKNELQRHFINGIGISSTFIVFISFQAHICVYVFTNFRFVGFELRGFSPLESEWAK